MYKIILYRDINGKSEIEEYIKNLNKNYNTSKDSRIKLNKITAYINMLRNEGLEIGEPYIKHIDDNIWELRPLRDRILFAYIDNNNFILLHYFMKKTQKTPKKEIEKAKSNLIDFKRRGGINGYETIYNLGAI